MNPSNSSLLSLLGLWRQFFALTDELRKPAGKPGVLCVPRADHDHSFTGNYIFANILAMVSAAHFDHDHDFAELAIDLHITQPDNIVREKRNGVVAELERAKRVLDFHRGNNRHARPGERGDHAVKRFAKV